MNVPKPMTHTPVKQQKRMVSRGRQRHRDTPVKLDAGYWMSPMAAFLTSDLRRLTSGFSCVRIKSVARVG